MKKKIIIDEIEYEKVTKPIFKEGEVMDIQELRKRFENLRMQGQRLLHKRKEL